MAEEQIQQPNPEETPVPQSEIASSFNIRSFIYPAMVIAFVLIAGFIYLTQKPQTTDNSNQVVEEVDDGSWKNYTNESLGFSLTFTDAWKGFTVEQQEGSQGVGAPIIVSFKVPTASATYEGGSGFATPLSIFAYPAEIWLNLRAELRANYITKSKDYYFTYAPWQEAPADLQDKNFEIRKVVSSFKLINTGEQESLDNVSYELQATKDYDAQILQIDKSGQKVVLADSIKNAVPELKEQQNRTFMKLSYPENPTKLYFYMILSDTDAPPMAVYSFEIATKKFAKLITASKYLSGFSVKQLEPADGRHVAVAGVSGDEKAQTLYLIDLDKDSASVLVELLGNETFNYCVDDCFGGVAGTISWLDKQTIQYTVYDLSKTTNSEQGKVRLPVGVRTVKLNIN